MKTLREKFKNTEGAINLLHCVFEFFQRCFCVLKAFLWAFLRKSKRIRDAALSTFIHHYTFAAKSKSIKYDSRRTIRVGMETIPCTTQ